MKLSPRRFATDCFAVSDLSVVGGCGCLLEARPNKANALPSLLDLFDDIIFSQIVQVNDRR